MLKEERHSRILKILKDRNTVKTTEIAEELDISLATARRDLNELDQSKSIKKIFGGAKKVSTASFVTSEESMIEKNQLNMYEKNEIGRFAARLIKDRDFVYMDAGTSVEAVVPFITAEDATFVTNSVGIARELSALKYKVFVLPGEIKLTTDSITGVAASEYVRRFNFSLGFFGTNGVHKDHGFTTPDINESIVKSSALDRCHKAYILADKSKFNKVSQVTFSDDGDLEIITNEEVEGKTQIVIKKLRGTNDLYLNT